MSHSSKYLPVTPESPSFILKLLPYMGDIRFMYFVDTVYKLRFEIYLLGYNRKFQIELSEEAVQDMNAFHKDVDIESEYAYMLATNILTEIQQDQTV